MIDSRYSNSPITIPFDFSKGDNHVLQIFPAVTTTTDKDPVTAADTWADTRNDITGAILTPNRATISIPQASNIFTTTMTVNIVQRIIAGTTGGYGWKRGVLTVNITCDKANKTLTISPSTATGNFPNDIRPVAVSLIMYTLV